MNISIRAKDSWNLAWMVVGVIGTIVTVTGVDWVNEIFGISTKWGKLAVIFIVFSTIWMIAFCAKGYFVRKGITLKIRNITVHIKMGDLFKQSDWKVIGFNEYFDTVVDDKIIARNSLNGIFIEKYVKEDLPKLRNVISKAKNDEDTKLKSVRSKNGKTRYPIGRLIAYDNTFMLLALTHFDQNQAHLTQGEYEVCLRNMWHEISRLYANRSVALPLLGGGITRFEVTKSSNALLRCMLCTLKMSNAQINSEITIVVTDKVMKELDVYEISRGVV